MDKIKEINQAIYRYYSQKPQVSGFNCLYFVLGGVWWQTHPTASVFGNVGRFWHGFDRGAF